MAGKLKGWGYEVHCGLAKTGVVGTLRCGTGNKTIGLRADLDACPLWNKAGNRGAVRNTGLSMDADMTVIRPCYFVPQNI